MYAYRLRRASPAREAGGRNPFGPDEDAEAARVFAAVLELFAATHEGVRIEVDGRPFGPWLAERPEPHRWHVRIGGGR